MSRYLTWCSLRHEQFCPNLTGDASVACEGSSGLLFWILGVETRISSSFKHGIVLVMTSHLWRTCLDTSRLVQAHLDSFFSYWDKLRRTRFMIESIRHLEEPSFDLCPCTYAGQLWQISSAFLSHEGRWWLVVIGRWYQQGSAKTWCPQHEYMYIVLHAVGVFFTVPFTVTQALIALRHINCLRRRKRLSCDDVPKPPASSEH